MILIEDLLKKEEGKDLDFKQSLPPRLEQLSKIVCSFANTAGGTIIIGIEDGTKKIIGYKDAEALKTIDQISQSLFDSIAPTPAFEVYSTFYKDKTLLIIEVYLGNQSPYFLKSKGKEKGTFIRIGATTRLADTGQIQELERRRLNTSYDEEIALGCKITDLDKNYIEALFLKLISKKIKTLDYENLGYIKNQGNKKYPTNGAMILFGNNPRFKFKISCAKFKNNDTEIIIDQKDFGGPLVDQIESTMKFILNYLPLEGKINTLRRSDQWKIPQIAIREALINAVVHRDYTISNADIKVGLFSDRLEITSPGALVKSINIDEIMVGRSEVRNKVIANTLKELKYIEQWGTGFQKIVQSCKQRNLIPPVFKESGLFFQVQLFTEKLKNTESTKQIKNKNVYESLDLGLTPQESLVLEYLKQHQTIKNSEAQKILQLSPSRCREILNLLVQKNLIQSVGEGKGRVYRLV